MSTEILLVSTLAACIAVAALNRLFVGKLAARAVRARSRALASAEASKDIELAIRFWLPEAILQATGTPQVQGRRAIRDVYRRFFGAIKQASSVSGSVIALPGGLSAMEYGTSQFVWPGTQGDVRDVVDYLAIWTRVRGRWYLAALSLTRVALSQIPSSEQPVQSEGSRPTRG